MPRSNLLNLGHSFSCVSLGICVQFKVRSAAMNAVSVFCAILWTPTQTTTKKHVCIRCISRHFANWNRLRLLTLNRHSPMMTVSAIQSLGPLDLLCLKAPSGRAFVQRLMRGGLFFYGTSLRSHSVVGPMRKGRFLMATGPGDLPIQTFVPARICGEPADSVFFRGAPQ